jgi:hypothetical protein
MRTIDVIPRNTLLRIVKATLATALFYLVLRAARFERLFLSDAEGVGTLIQIIGTLYSVLYAFATYVIWGQFTSVESEIFKEAGTLKGLVLFSIRLKLPAREQLMQAVRAYARAIVDTEWHELARVGPTQKTDRLFSEIVSAVASAKPEDENERLTYERLLEIADQAGVHRDARLSLSMTRIPRTLLVLVMLTASIIVLLLFVYPFRSTVLGVMSLSITTVLLLLAHFVIMDLDNPFAGAWNASPEPFEELVKKAR